MIVCCMPFVTHSGKKPNRLKMFQETYNSLHSIIDKFIIAVNCEMDYEILLEKNIDIEIVKLYDVEPIYLPLALVKHMQKNIQDDDILFFTESDHIFYIKDLNHILNQLNSKNYVVPHRLEKTFNNKSICELRGLAVGTHILHNGYDYFINNRNFEPEFDRNIFPSEGFYIPNNIEDSYGASYLILGKTFKKVNFDVDFYLNYLPERPAGVELFLQGFECYKSINYKDFWVDHLSAYENNGGIYV